MNKLISWFSAGVSSAVATKIAINDLGCEEIIYIKIEDEHPDNDRFVRECQSWFGGDIMVLQSPYKSVDQVNRSQRYINSINGAPCTKLLKIRVREHWESLRKLEKYKYVFGLDSTEGQRIPRLEKLMPPPKYELIFPLMEHDIDKKAAHCLFEKTGIKRPIMYELGYPNNNCIGCVKGKFGYWNKIREDFPEIFALRAARERDVGASCINGVYLDELEPGRGINNPIVPECGLFCDVEI